MASRAKAVAIALYVIAVCACAVLGFAFLAVWALANFLGYIPWHIG